jgi:hypothetical protein
LRSSRSSSSSAFQRITRRDDPAKLAALAAKYEALLSAALAIARRKARTKPQAVREILATGTAEGLASRLGNKIAAVRYEAEKYKRSWSSLIGWQYLEHGTPEAWADSMIETVEENIRMTETDSWPKPPPRRRKRKSRK